MSELSLIEKIMELIRDDVIGQSALENWKVISGFLQTGEISYNRFYRLSEKILALLPEPVKFLSGLEIEEMLLDMQNHDCALSLGFYERRQIAKALVNKVRKEETLTEERRVLHSLRKILGVPEGKGIELFAHLLMGELDRNKKPGQEQKCNCEQYPLVKVEGYYLCANCNKVFYRPKQETNCVCKEPIKQDLEYCSCYSTDRLDNGRNLCVHCNKMIEPKPGPKCECDHSWYEIECGKRLVCEKCGEEKKPKVERIEPLKLPALDYVLQNKINELIADRNRREGL